MITLAALQVHGAEAVWTARTLHGPPAVKPRAEPGTTAAPVLLLASGPAVRRIQVALGPKIALVVAEDVDRARALAATGGFVAILAVSPLATELRGAVAIDPDAANDTIVEVVTGAMAKSHTIEHADPIAALPYEEYIELARYATTRRYLIALLHRHGGSVTDAARGANMKRESLHRLMRRHHLIADDFRE